MITLPVYMESDLEWASQLKEATNCEGSLFWVFDWGREFCLHDPAFFSSSALAMEEFTKKIWPQFREQTAGVIFYEGEAYFADLLSFSEKTEKLLEEYFEAFPSYFERGSLYQLFAANSLSEFFHRMLAFLPEEVQGICRIRDSFQKDQAFLAQLLCKRRFEHLQLEMGKAWFTSTSPIAVSLPLDERLDECGRTQLNAIFSKWDDFRVIPEESLNEHWDGVDQIIALRAYTSDRAARMLEGFAATGGEVIFSE